MAAIHAARIGKKPVAGGGPGTFTLNPSAQSGYILSQSVTSWALARSGESLSAIPGSVFYPGTLYYPSDTYNPQLWEAYEAFLDFGLSGLVGTVQSATLSLGLQFDGSATDYTAEARTFDWGLTLTTADWIPGADLAAKTLLATLPSLNIGAVDTYKQFTESGTALKDAVVAAGTGVLRMVVCSDQHRNNTAPTDDRYMYFYAYNHTTLKPKLVVVTT